MVFSAAARWAAVLILATTGRFKLSLIACLNDSKSNRPRRAKKPIDSTYERLEIGEQATRAR